MSSYQRLVDALAAHGIKVGSESRSQTVRCPVHDDKTASLAISPGDEGALVYCHAGCSTDVVLAAVGLQLTDLYDKPQRASGVATEYDWTDEDGNLLYQSLRYRPKGFKQRRPDGNGGWHWNLHGVRRVCGDNELVDDLAVYVLEDASRLVWDAIDVEGDEQRAEICSLIRGVDACPLAVAAIWKRRWEAALLVVNAPSPQPRHESKGESWSDAQVDGVGPLRVHNPVLHVR